MTIRTARIKLEVAFGTCMKKSIKVQIIPEMNNKINKVTILRWPSLGIR